MGSPLLRPGLLQQGVAEAADVHVATHGARRMLGEDGRAVGVVEQPRGLGPAQGIVDRLLERGLEEETVGNIFWNNAIGVMECAVCDHAK